MTIPHDDQLRQAALRMETPARSEGVSAPVQITRTMLERAAVPRPQSIVLVKPQTLARFRQADGAGRKFRATAAAFFPHKRL